jgi:class 3 adenylate cyclase
LSDRLSEVPSLEERVADLLAVLDAAGSEHATLFGNADTGPACIAAAAYHPERISGLILCGTYAKGSRSDDYPFGWSSERWQEFYDQVRGEWGREAESAVQSDGPDPAFRRWLASMDRVGASPRAVLLLGEMTQAVDVRPLLSRVAVPTLVMHRVGDSVNEAAGGRYLAEHIQGARWVELPGSEFVLWAGDVDAIADEIEDFLTGRRRGADPTRVVATVMFTDVVRSTERAGELGDRSWAELLELLYSRMRAELNRYNGREIDTAGDGLFASFGSPTAAITCARAILREGRKAGLELRIGVHAGECEVVDDKLRGMAVHIGARVAAQAGPGEVLVSQTVKDLLAGSTIGFEDRGSTALKGVPGEWRLYAPSP